MIQSSLYERNAIALRPLRPKQSAALAAVRQAIREGHKRIILQAPTGMGKTLMAAHMIASAIEKSNRPLFTCPAITLVDQTMRAFEAEGIRDIGIIQAQHERTDWNAAVQIASVQTLIRRPLPKVHFFVVDEVHENFEGLNARLDSDEWKDKIAIGLSATPWARGMGLRWTKLIIAATIQELIDDGHLSPFAIYVPDHNLDRAKIKVVKGEFQDKSASEAMRSAVIVGDVVKTWKERGPGGKTFMFCVNRAHAKEQMQAFTDSGIPFGYIDATIEMAERRRVFAQMRHGEIAGIASVGCLIRGVDEDVRCIIDAQPTKSEMRHVQKWGRGLRMADGKELLIGLDHAGNTLAMGMVTDIHHETLDTRKPGEKADPAADKPVPKPKMCEKCHALLPAGKAVCPRCGERMKALSGVEARAGEMILYGGKKSVSFAELKAFLESKGLKDMGHFGHENALEVALKHGWKGPTKKTQHSKDDKQAFYSGLLGLANERGHKSGWVAHRYREKFGVWPQGLHDVPVMPSKKVRNFDHERRREYMQTKQEPAHVS